jgi:serine/threonine protein kinase
LPLPSSEHSIGRGPGNTLNLEGLLVSRRHALITFKDGQHLIFDRESTNGTYVNGQRIAQHALQPGDQIAIGPYVFVFQAAGTLISPPSLIRPVGQTPAPTRITDFGEYDRVETLGSGGMSTVYKAVSRSDGSTVAIKRFHQADPYLREKFEQEIFIGQSLGLHPHIAEVYGGGTSHGIYYMVMEYVDDRSLRERLRSGQQLSLDTIIATVGQTCDALSYAHARGVIHRDIKPENIMFSSQNGVQLVDFGIAKLATALTHTMDGVLIGTSYYMSYEQAQGLPVDPRSDVYSLGVVLYEMLTGQVPFKGDPLVVVNKHINEEPVPPRHLNASIPHYLEELIMRALAKDAGQRFQSAEGLARAVGYYAPFFAVSTQTPPLAAQTGAGRRPDLAPGATPVCLVILTSGQIIPLHEHVTVLRRRDLNPKDAMISREHARIARRGEYYWLQDLSSTNGTYLNEIRIFEPAALKPGDIIRCGHTQLRFERI